jgi:hypothetical protein
MTTNFTTVINNDTKLIITTIPDNINTKLDKYVENMYDSIYTEWYGTFFNCIFRIHPNMNAGIYSGILFDENILLHDDEKFIVNTAYELLTSAGFNVNPNKGYIHLDIFHIDTTIPTDTNYIVSCDNHISYNNYESCVFYTRKDQHIEGDLNVYSERPGIFDEGKYFVLQTKPNLCILRSGELYYQMQPHSGIGNEHVLSVHFCKKIVKYIQN